MKTTLRLTVLLGAALVFLRPAAAEELVGGPYSIQPLTLNGGGQTSTGGVYEMAASTAQPGGVGTVSAEAYTLEDGFWAAVLAALVTSGIDYDIAPDPIDGFIDARDLIGWVERIASGIEESELLFDFSRFWEVEFP